MTWKDNRDPSMYGGELLRWLEVTRERRKRPEFTPSELLDSGYITVPDFDEAEEMRRRQAESKNGHVPEPAEPTHALESPPDLVDAAPTRDAIEALTGGGLETLFVGAGPTRKLCSCGELMHVTPGLRYVCLNPECPRYEEVRDGE